MLQEEQQQLQLARALVRRHLLPPLLQHCDDGIQLRQAGAARSAGCQVGLHVLQQRRLQAVRLLRTRLDEL